MTQKTIHNKYDKAWLQELPLAQFEGRIVVVLNQHEAERAVDFLLTQPVLGFDTETRPSFTRGHQHKVSLMQVSADNICFLFRLNYTGLTPAIIRLLEDREVTKVGLSWHDDVNSLHHIGQFQLGTFIDIQTLAREIGIEDMSLQKIYANLFGQKISKRQQLSNWEADVLNDKQKIYAATDAWACVRMYREIMRFKQEGSYELIIKEENNETDKP
ncbi:MAG: 3'-5' exonuclease domain-containing protein 2 [Prevotella sp.]|nr:3'-5' exonuclease domain-containing protein 2 [Prevotella sp.]